MACSLLYDISTLLTLTLLMLMLDLTLIFMQNFSPLESLRDAAECADFRKLDSDPVGMAGVVRPKLK